MPRGVEKVSIETGLVALADNLRKKGGLKSAEAA